MTRGRSAFAHWTGPQKKPVIESSLLHEISEIAILENQACARKVALAAAIWDSCIHQNVQVGDHITDAGNYAASETARTLGCSKTVADTLADIGMDLRLRLPAIRAAFEAGELDLARVRAIYRTTNAYSLEATQRVETEILHAARRLSPGPLATEIAAIMQRTAPDETTELREDLGRLIGVRYRDKDIIATIEAELDAADAAACWQLINEMAATICPRDPRTRGQRLAAAYTTLMRRESYVPCTCEIDEGHPCTATRDLPDRRTPLINITIDLATLAGLTDLPAYLAGHGLIDADHARELANNSSWQLILTEAADLAEKLGLRNDPRTAAANEQSSTRNAENTRSAESSTRTDSADDSTPDDQPTPHPGQHLTFNPLGRSRRKRGLSLPKPRPEKKAPGWPMPLTHYHGSYTLIAALERAIAADPALATAPYPDGHGGLVTPTVESLHYRPSASLADCVRHRDRTCRHPGCDVPAANCEIDHIIPYLHHDPIRGGWTITTNLHCLCRYHHMLKTMGVWRPTMLAGAVEYWQSSSGTTAITLPGSTIGTTDMSDGSSIPHIPRKRRTVCTNNRDDESLPTDRQTSDNSVGKEDVTSEKTNGKTSPDEPAPF